ncbi:hypothetical protein FGADI_12794 [Fusarium gaditjirri]|uniref:Uncharacterized protein n=1 Tax=Fusarium gaditjirri TaxID=282569 RepID=A0A8H4SRE9_9HYPO|nr:hypothetical protein FGADI_12794 [Fusarium gaditjirri]
MFSIMFLLGLDELLHEALPPFKWALEQLFRSVQQFCEQVNWSETFNSLEQHITEILPENFEGLFLSLVAVVLLARFLNTTMNGALALFSSLVEACLIAYILAIIFFLVKLMMN